MVETAFFDPGSAVVRQSDPQRRRRV